ncbi:MAG: hypothetical protein IPK10_10420 [Bacteroidetes bacterium]|nr:hypothetical protein [Bacteroidota bacterium]
MKPCGKVEVWSDIPTAAMGEFYSLPDVSTGTRSSIEQALAGINFMMRIIRFQQILKMEVYDCR